MPSHAARPTSPTRPTGAKLFRLAADIASEVGAPDAPRNGMEQGGYLKT